MLLQCCSDVGICYLPRLQELKVAMDDYREKPSSSPLDRLNAPAEFSTPSGQTDVLKALRVPSQGGGQ